MSEQTTTPSPEKKQFLSRKQVLFLLGLVLINLSIYAGMWLLNQNNQSVSRSATIMVGEGLELAAAYKQALALALGWQPDVQLSSVTTSWQVASGDRLTLNRSAWSFQFFSPGTGQIQMVTVDGQGVLAGRLQPINTAPQHVVPDWSLDSDDLLLTFLSYGGQDFFSAHPRANVHLQLKGDDAGRSVWYVTAIDPVARQSLMVGMDARSRQIVVSETN